MQKLNIIVDNQDADKEFFNRNGTFNINIKILRKIFLDKFPYAQSWWDVWFLFPIAFVDFDRKHIAGFYPYGPRFGKYVPDNWVGEFVDFTNTYPEEIFPMAEKFWAVDGRDLLNEIIDRDNSANKIHIKTL